MYKLYFCRPKTCIIVNLYYYRGTLFDEMKILPSSPYAVFNAKEWDSVISSRKKNNKNSKCNFQNYYHKNFKTNNVKDYVRKKMKKTKLIQLSFA